MPDDATHPDPTAVLRDWMTIWQSELAALGVDREQLESLARQGVPSPAGGWTAMPPAWPTPGWSPPAWPPVGAAPAWAGPIWPPPGWPPPSWPAPGAPPGRPAPSAAATADEPAGGAGADAASRPQAAAGASDDGGDIAELRAELANLRRRIVELERKGKDKAGGTRGRDATAPRRRTRS